MKHLYIDLDETLLPFDSFPRFLMDLLPHLKLPGLFFSLQLPWLALPKNRPHLRPSLAHALQGKSVEPLESWCTHWVHKNLLPHIRLSLLPQAIPFSLCSLSLDLVVTPLAKELGGASLCTELGRSAKKFNGHLNGPQCGGEGKAQKIREDAQQRELNLADCGLLTDHHRDIPALEIVGQPLLINPTKKLRAWGQKHSAKFVDLHECPIEKYL